MGYQSGIGIIEQYGLGYVILTAGAKGIEAQSALEGMLLKVLMPAVEEAAREEAGVYTGNYTSAERVDVEGSMKVEIDNGPGLKLSELKHNGSNILEAIRTLWEAQVVSLGKISDEMRLYPTDVTKEVEVDSCEGKKVRIEEDWRLQYDPMFDKVASDLPVWDEQEQRCVGWQMYNSIVYGGEAVDRFVFVRDRIGGQVVEVMVPSLRLNLTVHE